MTARVPKSSDRPVGGELVALLAGLTAFGVVGIDLTLPAFGALREGFGLPSDSNRMALTVTAFFLGMAAGPIPFGAVADRWGRRPALWLSIAIFGLGSALSAISPTLNLLLASRFVAGVAASGARVVVLAIVRDRFEGQEMSRKMSAIMGIFLLTPVIATAAGAVLVDVFTWRAVFVVSAGFGLAMFGWSLRLSESLPQGLPRPNLLDIVPRTAIRMSQRRDVVAPLIVLTALQTTISVYLGSTEVLVNRVFGRDGLFPYVFAATSLTMSVAAFSVSRLLKRRSVRAVIIPSSLAHLALSALLLIVTVASDYQPNFWLFFAIFSLTMGSHMLLIPSLNAIILQPLPDVAATVAALSSTVLIAAGAVLGAYVDAQVQDRVTPVVVALTVVGVVQVVLVRVGLPGDDRPTKSSVSSQTESRSAKEAVLRNSD